MKRTLTILALVALCSAMMVSCKNKKSNELTLEEIQEQKVALADSVLVKIDKFVDEYIADYGNCFGLRAASFELSDTEKLVKPDYLLEPDKANNLVTKSQNTTDALIF